MDIQLDRDLVFFDVETTGLNVVRDRILQLGMVKLHKNGNPPEEFITLINPGIPISEESMAIHGITPKDLANKPAFGQLAQKIWDLLMNPDTLARITPAITSLEKIDDENFKAIADVKIGPVSGEFKGNLKLSEMMPYESFKLSIQQNSKVGNANAVMDMKLTKISDTQTEMSFNGDVKLSGMLNMMGQRVITPVANMLTKQFFDALEEEVAK